jgi:hypothetical protein
MSLNSCIFDKINNDLYMKTNLILKAFKFISLQLICVIIISCSQRDARVFVSNKTVGRTSTGIYFENIELKNDGEQPAYFVILMSTAYLKNNQVQYIEKGYGDIFPDESKTYTLTFDKLGLNNPDSIIYKITYSQSNINPIN